jgi:hypothetical protein
MTEPSRPHGCCCTHEDTPLTSAVLACPACGGNGRAVEVRTLRALLEPRWSEGLPEGPWRFCDSPACTVVYFGPAHTFHTHQLTVRVGLKETEPPRTLCYCFGHTEERLRAQWQATGRLDAIEEIRAAVKEGRCRCDVMNPSGACCLGEVLKATQALKGGPGAL